MKIVLSACVAGLVLGLAACASQPPTEPGEGVTVEQMRQAQTSGGFICNPGGCVCDPDSDDPVDSCDGMAKFCDRIGKGMLCEPGGWCFCKVSPVLTVGGAAQISGSATSAQIK